MYGEDHYSRKGCFAVHCLDICEDKARILDFVAGWPGSVHDNHVWIQSEQCADSNKFFSVQHYLLADSAFTSSSICVSVYKKKRGYATLFDDIKLFKTLLTQVRIKVEHCIGLLKNGFPSLCNTRILINGHE